MPTKIYLEIHCLAKRFNIKCAGKKKTTLPQLCVKKDHKIYYPNSYSTYTYRTAFNDI